MFTPSDYNYLMKVYAQLIASERNTSSSANCTIQIGKIEGELNNNCNIIISNMCNISNAIPLLDIAINKLLTMKANQSLNLSKVYNDMRLECFAKADLLQNISIQNILLGSCNATKPITFSFVNSGDATANCLTNALLSGTISAIDQTPPLPNVKLANENFTYVIGGFVLIGFLVVTFISVQTYKKAKLILYEATP